MGTDEFDRNYVIADDVMGDLFEGFRRDLAFIDHYLLTDGEQDLRALLENDRLVISTTGGDDGGVPQVTALSGLDLLEKYRPGPTDEEPSGAEQTRARLLQVFQAIQSAEQDAAGAANPPTSTTQSPMLQDEFLADPQTRIRTDQAHLRAQWQALGRSEEVIDRALADFGAEAQRRATRIRSSVEQGRIPPGEAAGRLAAAHEALVSVDARAYLEFYHAVEGFVQRAVIQVRPQIITQWQHTQAGAGLEEAQRVVGEAVQDAWSRTASLHDLPARVKKFQESLRTPQFDRLADQIRAHLLASTQTLPASEVVSLYDNGLVSYHRAVLAAQQTMVQGVRVAPAADGITVRVSGQPRTPDTADTFEITGEPGPRNVHVEGPVDGREPSAAEVAQIIADLPEDLRPTPAQVLLSEGLTWTVSDLSELLGLRSQDVADLPVSLGRTAPPIVTESSDLPVFSAPEDDEPEPEPVASGTSPSPGGDTDVVWVQEEGDGAVFLSLPGQEPLVRPGDVPLEVGRTTLVVDANGANPQVQQKIRELVAARRTENPAWRLYTPDLPGSFVRELVSENDIDLVHAPAGADPRTGQALVPGDAAAPGWVRTRPAPVDDGSRAWLIDDLGPQFSAPPHTGAGTVTTGPVNWTVQELDVGGDSGWALFRNDRVAVVAPRHLAPVRGPEADSMRLVVSVEGDSGHPATRAALDAALTALAPAPGESVRLVGDMSRISCTTCTSVTAWNWSTPRDRNHSATRSGPPPGPPTSAIGGSGTVLEPRAGTFPSRTSTACRPGRRICFRKLPPAISR